MSNVDTPDYQRGSVSAQIIAGSAAAGSHTVTAKVPPNAETLVVMAFNATLEMFALALGTTSGQLYPVATVPTPNGGGFFMTFYCDCSSVVDGEMEIELNPAPTEPWFVYADAGVHLTYDQLLGQLTAGSGVEFPVKALMVGGSNGVGLEPFKTNNKGQQYVIPTVPATDAGDHPVTELLAESFHTEANEETVIAAPGAGLRLRVFAGQLSLSGLLAAWLVDARSSIRLFSVQAPGTSSLTLPAQGYPLRENAALAYTRFVGTGAAVGTVYYTVEHV